MRALMKLMILMCGLAMITLAASPALAGESVTVEVRIIAATADGNDFDDELEDIRNRLERGFSDYSSFEQLGRQSQQIRQGRSQNFSLPTGDTLTLSYNGSDDEFVKLGLVLENRLSTNLRATSGSTFFQAGLNYQDGTLVLAITVE